MTVPWTRKRVLAILLIFFLISFLIKLLPIYGGYKVPLGYVDTSYHVATAIDVKEGNFRSLIHPWWHIKDNIQLVGGYLEVDRNSVTFFYPPIIHIALAIGMLFGHPGVAAIIVISLLYSLSVFAIFYLCKSFKFGDFSSLAAAALVATSYQLLYSQIYGFWTFTVALNFLFLSLACIRLGKLKMGIMFAIFSALTHWFFAAAVVLLGLFELLYYRNKKAKRYLLWSAICLTPFFLLFFVSSKLSSYSGSHFSDWLLPSKTMVILVVALVLAGLILNFKKYMGMNLIAAGVIILSFVYYGLGIKILYGDMVQFSYPIIASFFIAGVFETDFSSLFDRVSKKTKLLSVLAISIFAVLTICTLHLGLQEVRKIYDLKPGPSISNDNFNQMLLLRERITSEDIIAIDTHIVDNDFNNWWITSIGKDAKIIINYRIEENPKDIKALLLTMDNGKLALKEGIIPKETIYRFG